MRESLAMNRKLQGNENLDVARALNGLASALLYQRKLAEAETLFGDSLGIYRKLEGNENLEVARCLNNLALVLKDQGKLAEAEAM